MPESEGEKKPLPTTDELKRYIHAAGITPRLERNFVRRFTSRSVDSEERYARLKGLQDHYRHKGAWSLFLMALMAGMIGFQSYLLVRVGQGVWDFSEYSWLLPALLAQNLAQIVGLAVFVVRSLFGDPKITVAPRAGSTGANSDEQP